LPAHIDRERGVGGGAGHHHASRHRDQQRRDHGDQAVAHGEHGVGFQRLAKGNIQLEDADQKSGDDVDGGYQNGGDGIALAEARRPVHGAVKFCIAGNLLPPLAGLAFVDQPGIQIGVDSHLLSRHGIKGEARRDFGGAHRAVGDNEVLNGNQGDEEHESDDVIAAHHELAKGLDHVSGGGHAFVAMQQDAPAGGQIQREPEQGQQQDQAGKDRELRGPQNLDRRQQH
jgi:hypothetical protein